MSFTRLNTTKTDYVTGLSQLSSDLYEDKSEAKTAEAKKPAEKPKDAAADKKDAPAKSEPAAPKKDEKKSPEAKAPKEGEKPKEETKTPAGDAAKKGEEKKAPENAKADAVKAPEKAKAGEEKKKADAPKPTMQEQVIDAAKKANEKKVMMKPLNGDPTLRMANPAVLDPMRELNFKSDPHPDEDNLESVQMADKLKENPMGKLGGAQKIRDDAKIIMNNGPELRLKDNTAARNKIIAGMKEEEDKKAKEEAKNEKEKKEKEEQEATQKKVDTETHAIREKLKEARTK